MNTLWMVRVLFVAALAVGNLAHAMEPPFHPPTATFLDQDFEGVHGIPPSWQVALGTWQADGQTYNSTTAASTALTTIFEYPFLDSDGTFSTTDHFAYSPFTLQARLRNQGSSAGSLVGLVYSYVDPANYNEVVFSPTGVAYLRRVLDGQMQTLAAATYPGAGQGVWFRVEVERTFETTSVRVNGVQVYMRAPQSERGDTQGQIGLSTYNAAGRFNKISISIPYGQQPFTEDFSDGVANGFASPQGTFVVSNGTYVDTAVHLTGQASAPVDFGRLSTLIVGYALHVRMFNPYSGPGNLVGLVYDDGFVDGRRVYQEVVFSPTGVAQLRRHVGNTIQVLNSAAHTVGPRTWFRVTMVMSRNDLGPDRGPEISVAINGAPLFTHEHVELVNEIPRQLALVTHWTPARFDDFVFDLTRPGPVVASRETFVSGLAAGDVRSGNWNTQGGTLNNESFGAADIAVPGQHSGKPDYSYQGRLLNQWGNSGNQIGLVFSYASAEDYFEVVFAQTGQAYLNLYMEGTRYRLATGTHNVPRNVWFNVEVIRRGPTATVRLNGSPLFQNVPVGQLPDASFGVVSHFSLGHFDNLTLREL
jgi:hypothetical protein